MGDCELRKENRNYFTSARKRLSQAPCVTEDPTVRRKIRLNFCLEFLKSSRPAAWSLGENSNNAKIVGLRSVGALGTLSKGPRLLSTLVNGVHRQDYFIPAKIEYRGLHSCCGDHDRTRGLRPTWAMKDPRGGCAQSSWRFVLDLPRKVLMPFSDGRFRVEIYCH